MDGDDNSPVYCEYEEDAAGVEDQNGYGHAGSSANDSEVLMTTASHKKGKHHVLMSSGKKDTTSGGKAI